MADLPDEALARCLFLLPIRERLRSAALVSKRFAAAACSPELLREVDVSAGSLAAVRSLTVWLARHGRHVQRLNLSGPKFGLPPAEAVIFEAAMTACLMTAGAGGQLLELTARWIASTEWLSAMPSLHRLDIWPPSAALRLPPAVSMLTALGSLRVEGSVGFEPGTRLPTSITFLELSSLECDAMPEQFAQLPQLARLEMQWCHFSAASMAPLSSLSSSLTWLEVSCGEVPGSLAALTRLQHFLVWYGELPEGAGQALSGALRHLTQLTSLVLLADDLGPDTLASLACLPRLQRCYVSCLTEPEQAPSPLPGGPWLASLRWLGASVSTLVASTALLSSAHALEFVEVTGPEGAALHWYSPAAADFFTWLAKHPPLCRVSFSPLPDSTVFNSWAFTVHLAELWRCRPALNVHCIDFEDIGGSDEQTFIRMLARGD